mmetsp:Transcript_37623/g.106891  ORF Transcript_37623/g.106891 Transcript_37623/m.106891 type:complete len:346 (+) Transcript_37623:87-1124(+)
MLSAGRPLPSKGDIRTSAATWAASAGPSRRVQALPPDCTMRLGRSKGTPLSQRGDFSRVLKHGPQVLHALLELREEVVGRRLHPGEAGGDDLPDHLPDLCVRLVVDAVLPGADDVVDQTADLGRCGKRHRDCPLRQGERNLCERGERHRPQVLQIGDADAAECPVGRRLVRSCIALCEAAGWRKQRGPLRDGPGQVDGQHDVQRHAHRPTLEEGPLRGEAADEPRGHVLAHRLGDGRLGVVHKAIDEALDNLQGPLQVLGRRSIEVRPRQPQRGLVLPQVREGGALLVDEAVQNPLHAGHNAGDALPGEVQRAMDQVDALLMIRLDDDEIAHASGPPHAARGGPI